MNAKRRKRITAIYEELEGLMEEEQEAFDNLPESFQDSERGKSMEEAIQSLETARDELEMIIN